MMTKEVFEAHLRELCSVIETLPEPQRGQLEEMVEETRRRYASIRGSLARARDALDDIRLYQKYLVFDAEARAREAQAHRNDLDEETES